MSWNPRRFANYVNDELHSYPDQIMLWLSADAVDRVRSAAENGIRYTQSPLPSSSLIIGLGRPLELTRGASALITVESAEVVERKNALNQRRGKAGVGPGLTVAVARNNSPRGGSALCAVCLSIRDGSWHENRIMAEPAAAGAAIGEPVFLVPADDIPESEALLISTLIRGAWTLYNEPEEVSAAAVTVGSETVTIGKKRKARPQDIVVVDVRRRVREAADPEPGEEERPTVEHDFRWPVRGHWRMQPCGTGRAERRKIWIDAYVAGPEDKPLKTRTRVSVVG